MSRHSVAERASRCAFFGAAALLFTASAAATIVWSASMSSMGRMPMPGGWTMSLAWTRMCGQTWLDLAASFLGMWVAMMVAMMLPSLAPMLWRYRETLGSAGATRLSRLTALVGLAYFLVWSAFGLIAFALGVALAALEMQWPALVAHCSIRGRRGRPRRRRAAVHGVEGPSSCLLPQGVGVQPDAAGKR